MPRVHVIYFSTTVISPVSPDDVFMSTSQSAQQTTTAAIQVWQADKAGALYGFCALKTPTQRVQRKWLPWNIWKASSVFTIN